MLKADFQDTAVLRDAPRAGALKRPWRIAVLAACALCLLAVFARVMTYPMQHDEQFYISAGVLFDRYSLYSGMGFSHLPNIALLFAGAFALLGDAHYLLIGRLLVAVAWAGTFATLLLIARDYVRSVPIGGLMIALLALNPMLLNATGMTATNNFLPVPFMLFGLYLFLRAADRDTPSPALALASGFALAVGAGFKANYLLFLIPFAVAALLVPRAVSFRSRLLRVALPLLAGGIIGGLPSILYALGDMEGFVAHVVNAHRGPQLAYWAAHADPNDPKVIGIADKLLMAHRLWLSGVTMLILVLSLTLAGIAVVRRRTFVLRWPLLLTSSLAAIGMTISFVPTPAFPQYFTPPLPFAVVLAGLLFGSLDTPGRDIARPVLVAVLALTLVTGAPLLLPSLAGLARPSGWTGVQVARDGRTIAALVGERSPDAPVATLSPIHALEGHLPIYPQFALGPFLVRAAPWVSAADRRHYGYFVTPDAVPSLLASEPPSAILTGMEGANDAPLDSFAKARGYREVPLSLKKAEDAERVRIYLTP